MHDQHADRRRAGAGRDGRRRLLLTAQNAGGVHYALVTNGATDPSSALLKSAQDELNAWAAAGTWP